MGYFKRTIETDSIVAYNGTTLTYYPKNSSTTVSVNGKLLTICDGLVELECEEQFAPGDFIYHSGYQLYGIIKKIEPLCDNQYRILFVVSDVLTRKYMIKDDYCDTKDLTKVRFMTDDERGAFLNKLNGHYYNYVFTDNKIYRRGIPTTGEYVKLVKWGTMEEIYCITGIGSNIADTEYTPVCFMETNKKGVWNINTKPLLPFKFINYIVMPCSIQEIDMMNKVLLDGGYIFHKANLRIYELPDRVYGQQYYYIASNGNIVCDTDDGHKADTDHYNCGNYFPNEVVAQDYANKIIHVLLGDIDDTL